MIIILKWNRNDITRSHYNMKKHTSHDTKNTCLDVDKLQYLSNDAFNKGSEKHQTIQVEKSVLNISTYLFSEIQIVLLEGCIYQEIEIPIRDNREYLSLAFVKEGTVTTKSKLCNYESTASPGSASLCCHGSFDGTAHFSPTKNLKIVSICFPRKYLMEFDTIIENCNANQAKGYMSIPMKNNLLMQKCVDMLLNPPIMEMFKQVFLQGKAYELISLSIQSMFSQPIPESNINEKEKHRVYKARDILENSLLNPPKLPTLARLVGTNDFKLKKDFKSVFNTSPYAYVIKCRMEKAYHSIINSDMPITTIAQNLGYNNTSHFSSTFFKHYGVKPRELKHLRKQG